MKDKTVHYIPAAPGFYTIELVAIADKYREGFILGYEAFKRPIIAWKLSHQVVENYCLVAAVTPQGQDFDDCPIVYPDGRVERADDYECESVQQWVEMQEKKMREAEVTK